MADVGYGFALKYPHVTVPSVASRMGWTGSGLRQAWERRGWAEDITEEDAEMTVDEALAAEALVFVELTQAPPSPNDFDASSNLREFVKDVLELESASLDEAEEPQQATFGEAEATEEPQQATFGEAEVTLEGTEEETGTDEYLGEPEDNSVHSGGFF